MLTGPLSPGDRPARAPVLRGSLPPGRCLLRADAGLCGGHVMHRGDVVEGPQLLVLAVADDVLGPEYDAIPVAGVDVRLFLLQGASAMGGPNLNAKVPLPLPSTSVLRLSGTTSSILHPPPPPW